MSSLYKTIRDTVQKKVIKENVDDSAYDCIDIFETLDAAAAQHVLETLAKGYKARADQLTNMNALEISKHLSAAAKLIGNRTGN